MIITPQTDTRFDKHEHDPCFACADRYGRERRGKDKARLSATRETGVRCQCMRSPDRKTVCGSYITRVPLWLFLIVPLTKYTLSLSVTPTRRQLDPWHNTKVGLAARVPPQRATARPVAYILAIDSHIGDGPLTSSASSCSGVVATSPGQGGMLSRRTGGRKCGLHRSR